MMCNKVERPSDVQDVEKRFTSSGKAEAPTGGWQLSATECEPARHRRTFLVPPLLAGLNFAYFDGQPHDPSENCAQEEQLMKGKSSHCSSEPLPGRRKPGGVGL